MNEGRVERARRWYRLVLRIYPQRHRDRYAAEMEETFIVLLRRDHARHQRWGRVRCWTGAVWDALARGTLMRVRGIGPRVRHLGGWDMMGSMASDIRFGVRSLVRRPLFAATAVATLALGIGANASVFTVVEGIMFRPLPYEEPDELVYIWDENPTLGWEHTDVSAANAWDWRERVRAFDDLVVFGNVQYNMTSEGPPELVTGVTTSPNLFRVLGRAPVLGRDFAAHEMGEDVDRVAILSHGFWERRFGADPDVLGGTVVLDGRQTTVIGVLPPDFLFLDGRPDLFVPLARHPSQEPRENHNMNAVARLADGATVSLARTEAAQVAGALAEEYPEANEGWKVSVVPAHEELVGRHQTAGARRAIGSRGRAEPRLAAAPFGEPGPRWSRGPPGGVHGSLGIPGYRVRASAANAACLPVRCRGLDAGLHRQRDPPVSADLRTGSGAALHVRPHG
jgi:hypothetical protein